MRWRKHSQHNVSPTLFHATLPVIKGLADLERGLGSFSLAGSARAEGNGNFIRARRPPVRVA